MKFRYFSLLVASVIILTSMSDCEHVFFYGTVDDYVSVTINGVEYECPPVTTTAHQHFLNSPHIYFNENDCTLRFIRNVVDANSNDFVLRIHLFSYEPFELNKRYPILPEVIKPGYESRHAGEVLEPVKGGLISYNIVSGWMEFTDTTDHYLSGRFEFDCGDYEAEYGGDDEVLLEVRNGEFGPILTNFVRQRYQ